jgi:hypothetical protein
MKDNNSNIFIRNIQTFFKQSGLYETSITQKKYYNLNPSELKLK